MNPQLEQRINELGEIINSVKNEEYSYTYDSMEGQYAPRKANTWVTETRTRVVPKYSKKERHNAYKQLIRIKKQEQNTSLISLINAQTREYEKQRNSEIKASIKAIIVIGILIGLVVWGVVGIRGCVK